MHEILDTIVFGAETVVMFLLTCSTRLLSAAYTCSDTCYNVGRSDSLTALGIATMGAVRHLEHVASGHKPREERL
jgi:hypothetical protein